MTVLFITLGCAGMDIDELKFVIKAEAIISSIINIDITLKYIKP